MDVSAIPLLSVVVFLPLVGAIVVGFASASVARPTNRLRHSALSSASGAASTPCDGSQ